MGFFVDRHVVPGRVGLLSMTLLVERTLINSIYSSLPEISYHCWLLDYLIVSFVLVSQVFGMLADFVVPYLSRKGAICFEHWWLRHMVDETEDEIQRSGGEDDREQEEAHMPGDRRGLLHRFFFMYMFDELTSHVIT